jgi:hypothetical protein
VTLALTGVDGTVQRRARKLSATLGVLLVRDDDDVVVSLFC